MTLKGDIAATRAELTGTERSLLEQRLARAREVAAQRSAPRVAIARRVDAGDAPLSFAQEGLWFLDQLEPGRAVYNVCQAVRINGPLNIAALERSLNEIVRRHEVLRTNFVARDGHPVQVVAGERKLPLRVVHLDEDPGRDPDVLVHAALQEESRWPFDLARDRLIRALLVRSGPARHTLMVTMHHIVSDGWSIGVFFQELARLYTACVSGREPDLPELGIQFSDYAVWERELMSAANLDRLLGFWRKQLEGSLPSLDLPFDFAPGANVSSRGGVQALSLPAALSAGLKELAQREGATLFITLLAAFETLLHRWTGQNDIVVGSVVAGRRKVELEKLIGYFVNTLVFRGRTDGNPTFREMLARVRETTLSVLAHQELPFERLVQELRPDRSLHRNPLFQVMFVLQNAPMSTVALPDVQLEPLEIDTGTAKFDLTLSMIEEPQGLRAAIEYNADLFSAETAGRLLQSFQTLLHAIVDHPGERIGSLEVVPAAERHQVLVAWNATAAPYERELCIHEAFERQVRSTPEAAAIVGKGERLTYAALNDAADRLAARLRARGVRRETLVGLFARRTPQLLVGMLGILKAGGAYVPLDPAYPRERIRFMVEDAQMAVIVTEQALAVDIPPARAAVVCVDDTVDRDGVDGAAAPNAKANACPTGITDAGGNDPPTPDNVAYVIYTSGSTGRPKGVCVLHRGVMALTGWARGMYSPEELRGVLFSTSVCFDVSVFESLVPLCLGGTIIVAENILAIGSAPAGNEVTLVSGVPSAMTEVVRARLLPSSVRTVILAGEPCPQSLVEAIYALGHVERVYDVYGPTETTVYSVGGLRRRGGHATIGRPLANERAYVLDGHGQPVPRGVRGELFIAGDKVARGYLNRPELTAQKFLPDPFWVDAGGATPGDGQHRRMYRTGDAVRWLADGTLEYLGRLDRQVKIRGFRIEPAEIESGLKQHPSVKECAVVARDDTHGAKLLVAYVVWSGPAAPPDSLRHFLEQRLPDYFVPSAFVPLAALPLSPNGKLDVAALPAIGAAPERQNRYVAPRDGVEQRLIAVWEDVLGVRPVGVLDNFFELGGHSLLAVRMAAQVERRFGQKLPLSMMFRAPTIERLARAIREEGLITAGSSLVEIQPRGSRAPIFWLHTLGGGGGAGLFTYQKLAQRLGPDQPSYGLVAPGGEHAANFEAMAAFYIREMRLVQAKGPFRLGGYCFGGVLAYEMARQLHAAGDQVGLVILMDSFPPNPPGLPGRFSLRFAAHLFTSAPPWLGQALRHPRENVHRFRKIGSRIRRTLRSVFETADDAVRASQQLADLVDMEHYPPEFKSVAEAHWRAMVNYHPQPFPGHLVLFRTHRPRLLTYPPEYQWRKLAGRVDVRFVSGTHEDILNEPQVAEVSAALSEILNDRSTLESVR